MVTMENTRIFADAVGVLCRFTVMSPNYHLNGNRRKTETANSPPVAEKRSN